MEKDKIVEIVDKFSGYLAQMYKFGFYEIEDLKQEAVLRSLEAINNKTYDDSKSLEKYLFMVVQNHFKNLLRKYRQKNEPPCLTCPLFDPEMKFSKNQCTKFVNKDDCSEYSNFDKKYKARQSILSPADLSSISEDQQAQLVVEYDYVKTLEDTELYECINRCLPPLLRADFLRMLSGVRINVENTRQVQKAVAIILIDNNFEITNFDLESFIGDANGNEEES